MTLKQLKRIATKSLKDGPVITEDSNGNIYQAYIVFLREGLKYRVVVIDKDIVDLNGPKSGFMYREVVHIAKHIGILV